MLKIPCAFRFSTSWALDKSPIHKPGITSFIVDPTKAAIPMRSFENPKSEISRILEINHEVVTGYLANISVSGEEPSPFMTEPTVLSM
jgi:hypothetical protein